jgi:hypothetical protein
MQGHLHRMLIKPATSHTLTQCWYSRTHVPMGRKERGEGDILTSTCRYCERPLRSHGGKSWVLADAVDLDELGARSLIRYICVTNFADGMIVARYVIDPDADEAITNAQLEAISESHGAKVPGSGLDVQLKGGLQS